MNVKAWISFVPAVICPNPGESRQHSVERRLKLERFHKKNKLQENSKGLCEFGEKEEIVFFVGSFMPMSTCLYLECSNFIFEMAGIKSYRVLRRAIL